MCSEGIYTMAEWLIALLGVAVGFALNEGASVVKVKIKVIGRLGSDPMPLT
jgi:hypothetical protein